MFNTVTAMIAAWTLVVARLLPRLDAAVRATVDGSQVTKLVTEKDDSPIYAAKESTRKAFPSANYMSRAYWFAQLDTPALRDAWKASPTATPNNQDYLKFLKVMTGRGFASTTAKANVEKQFTITKRGAKVAKATLIAPDREAAKAKQKEAAATRKKEAAELKEYREGKRGSVPSTLPSFLVTLLGLDREKLAEAADSAGDLSWIDDEMLPELVTAMVARVLLNTAPAEAEGEAPAMTAADKLKAKLTA